MRYVSTHRIQGITLFNWIFVVSLQLIKCNDLNKYKPLQLQ